MSSNLVKIDYLRLNKANSLFSEKKKKEKKKEYMNTYIVLYIFQPFHKLHSKPISKPKEDSN